MRSTCVLTVGFRHGAVFPVACNMVLAALLFCCEPNYFSTFSIHNLLCCEALYNTYGGSQRVPANTL